MMRVSLRSSGSRGNEDPKVFFLGLVCSCIKIIYFFQNNHGVVCHVYQKELAGVSFPAFSFLFFQFVLYPHYTSTLHECVTSLPHVYFSSSNLCKLEYTRVDVCKSPQSQVEEGNTVHRFWLFAIRPLCMKCHVSHTKHTNHPITGHND